MITALDVIGQTVRDPHKFSRARHLALRVVRSKRLLGRNRAPDQPGRRQIGGTTSPFRCAMTSITIPVVVQSPSASTEDSMPKLPPVK